MTFLKKLGEIIVKGIGIASGLLPLVSAAVPGSNGAMTVVSKDLAEIAQIVVSAEAMGAALGLSGPDKLRAATTQAVQVFLQSAILVGKPITDPAAVEAGTQSVVNGIVQILNAVHPSAAVETPVQLVPAPEPPANA